MRTYSRKNQAVVSDSTEVALLSDSSSAKRKKLDFAGGPAHQAFADEVEYVVGLSQWEEDMEKLVESDLWDAVMRMNTRLSQLVMKRISEAGNGSFSSVEVKLVQSLVIDLQLSFGTKVSSMLLSRASRSLPEALSISVVLLGSCCQEDVVHVVDTLLSEVGNALQKGQKTSSWMLLAERVASRKGCVKNVYIQQWGEALDKCGNGEDEESILKALVNVTNGNVDAVDAILRTTTPERCLTIMKRPTPHEADDFGEEKAYGEEEEEEEEEPKDDFFDGRVLSLALCINMCELSVDARRRFRASGVLGRACELFALLHGRTIGGDVVAGYCALLLCLACVECDTNKPYVEARVQGGLVKLQSTVEHFCVLQWRLGMLSQESLATYRTLLFSQ